MSLDVYDRAHLLINHGVLERVLEDCKRNPTVEIGGRWFGYYIPIEERWEYDEELGTEELPAGDIHYVIDYIPSGPNPITSDPF